VRERDARRARLGQKLDEDLASLRRDLLRRIAISPLATPAGKEALAHAVETMLAHPKARLALKALRQTSKSLGPVLDPQRKTENFDALFRHEVSLVFFQAARSLVDGRPVTTPADTEAWRQMLADDVERCGSLAAAAMSIGEDSEARTLRNDAAIGRLLLANLPTLDDPRVMLRPGGSDPRRMKRPHRLDERNKSREPATLEAYRVALGVLADVDYALRDMLRWPSSKKRSRGATTVAAYIASAATGFSLDRLDIERMVEAAKKRASEAAAC
jgi:hypothetical protein